MTLLQTVKILTNIRVLSTEKTYVFKCSKPLYELFPPHKKVHLIKANGFAPPGGSTANYLIYLQ